MTFPRELLTDRLRLRQWEDRDIDRLAQIYTDPGYLEHMPVMDREATAAQVARFGERWETDGFSHWAAEERATGTLIGRIGLLCHHDWPLEAAPVEVGWTLAPEARGRGLATEGGHASLGAAFAHLEVGRVISITTPGNARSRRVMEKLGLSLRGDARWHQLDVVWYALDRPGAPPLPR